MKKSNLWTGIAFVAAGIGFLLAALLLDTPLESLFCGFAGALTVPGLVQIYKYVKWSSPHLGAEYREKLEQEQIDLRDERKAMLRDKAGRYAYVLGIVLTSASIVAFAALDMLDVIGEAEGRLLVLFLSFFLVVQYFAGLVIYRLLARRY